jgi:hypothetical protein
MQPFFTQDKLTLYCGDLRQVLPTLPENRVWDRYAGESDA